MGSKKYLIDGNVLNRMVAIIGKMSWDQADPIMKALDKGLWEYKEEKKEVLPDMKTELKSEQPIIQV